MRFFFFFLFSVLVLLSLCSAQELSVFQEEYLAGETVQVEIENMTVRSSDISLFDSSSQKVSISPLLLSYREGYTLVYFDLPLSLANGSYTFSAAGIQDGFQVVSGSEVMQVRPGVVVLDRAADSFSVTVEAVKGSFTVFVNSSDPALVPRKSSFDLNAGSSKSVYVDYDYSQIESDSELLLSYANRSYRIPLIYPEEVIGNETVVENFSEALPLVNESVKELQALVFLVSVPQVDLALHSNESLFGDLKVQNTLNETLYNLSYSLTGNLAGLLSMNVSSLASLSAGEIYTQRIWVNRDNQSREGNYSGDIVLENELYSVSLPLSISVSAPEEVLSTQTSGNVSFLNESELLYLNQASDEGAPSSTEIVIGVTLIVLLLLIFLFLFLKLGQRRGEKKFQEYIEETKRK